MTQRAPTDSQWADIRLGYEVAQALRRFDIGQSIAVLLTATSSPSKPSKEPTR